MICGGCTPLFFYGFYCNEQRWLQYLYLGGVWTICLVALAIALRPHTKQWVIAAAYIVAGHSIAPGAIHLSLLDKKYVFDSCTWDFAIAG